MNELDELRVGNGAVDGPVPLPDGTPFSEVVETYTGEVLAFPEPLWR